ncbi:hypothetical protein [Devosia alba]|uniref:hypothetical protein n=1 Tax=Devosia alba TaxID=3152360 RepID=UPI0032664BCE
MLSSKFLKDVLDEAYPIIKRQLEDAEVIASFRDLVTANGGDWSALKALMKAHVQDSLDDSGEGKRVKKILEKADSSNAYAGMLGLANMNEKNYFEGEDDDVGAPSNLQKVQTAPTEPQPPVSAGSDLAASPANDDGQVADNPVAKAADDANSGDAMSEVSAAADAPERADVASRVAGDRAPAATSEDMDVTGGESAATKSLYAPKGETVWELTPPEGVIRHEYSQAFGEAGQDIAVIEDDMANAASAPIVKIGNVILDGWARYLKARELGIEYPVEQYAGTDSLMDCIKWNTGGRMMTSEQSFRIAQRLAKAEPKRKADIYAAFELGMALA